MIKNIFYRDFVNNNFHFAVFIKNTIDLYNDLQTYYVVILQQVPKQYSYKPSKTKKAGLPFLKGNPTFFEINTFA